MQFFMLFYSLCVLLVSLTKPYLNRLFAKGCLLMKEEDLLYRNNIL